MSDGEALAIYEHMKRIYGQNLPDPDHEPIRFIYYYKLYKQYHGVK
jgi:hypothetical protein